jgi:hypothetical protein
MKPSLIYELDRLVNGRDDSPITSQELSSSPAAEALGGIGFFASSLGVSPENLIEQLEEGLLPCSVFAAEMNKILIELWSNCSLTDIVSELCEDNGLLPDFSVSRSNDRPVFRIGFKDQSIPLFEVDEFIMRFPSSEAYRAVRRLLQGCKAFSITNAGQDAA